MRQNGDVPPNLDWKAEFRFAESRFSQPLYQYWFLLVQWLTESRFGKTKFGFPIEIRSRTRLGDLKLELENKQSTESLMSAGIGCVCFKFFVLCNRHWFNKAPGPDPRGTEMGVTYLPFTISSDAGYADLPLPLLGAPVSIEALVKLGSRSLAKCNSPLHHI